MGAICSIIIKLAAVGCGVAVMPSTSVIRDPRLHVIPIVHGGVPDGEYSPAGVDQRAFAHRVRMNGLAARGEWKAELEKDRKAA